MSSGLQMFGAYQEGRSQKLQGQLRAIRYATQAEAGRTRAVQVEGAYAEDLNTSLAAINAITAGQNRGVDSATSLALLDKAETINKRASLTAASNERLRALGAEADAQAALRAGDEAMRASYLKMVKPGLDFVQGLKNF